jgi:NADH dehydrogenase
MNMTNGPMHAVAGSGEYRMQPIHVEDFARLAVELGFSRDDVVVDAVGPEIRRFDETVQLVAAAVGSRARIVHLPPRLVLALGRVMGVFLRDVLLTRDEVSGLSSELLVSARPPTGTTAFGDWVAEHGDALGRSYASELTRHYR